VKKIQILASLALLLLPATASAQDALPGVFSEVIDVRVVNVEVVVEDKDGLRVQGLGPEDFVLMVDDKEVPVEFFSEIRGSAVVAREAGSGPQGLPSLEPGRPVGTSYLVFIDDFFPISADRDRVLDRLREQAGQLGPADRMAVVAYDGKVLTMLTSWTGNQATIDRAFTEAQRRPAKGLERRVEKQTMERNRGISALGTGGFHNGLGVIEREYARVLAEQVGRVVDAATATLRSFAMPPGRKVMMLLSGGWPLDPTVYTIGNTGGLPTSEPGVPSGNELLQPLVDTANRIGYTLYPVDVPGLSRQTSVDVTQTEPRAAFLDTEEQELHAALHFAARETGGKSLLNALRGDALNRVAEDVRSYYWLGFSPSGKRDDERHEIEVRTSRPGLRIRSRDDYVDYSRGQEVTAMLESSLLFGSAPATGALPVELGKPTKSRRNQMEVPIAVAIPVDGLTFLAAGGGWVAKAELRVGALDSNGQTADVSVLPIELKSDTAPKSGGYVRYDTRVSLRRLEHRLVLSIYDPLSDQLFSSTVSVKP
jgi:VWFA-related protein